jgi:jasmonate ZIM domain-containing protein
MAAEQQLQPAKAAAGGSRFAVTCGLLRQYMKEQGGSGATRCLAPAVAMGLMPEADAAAAAATEERTTVLELFPQQAGTLKDEQQRCVHSPSPSVSPSLLLTVRM